MAIKDLQKSFKDSLNEAVKKYNAYASSLGAETLVEFNFIIEPLVKSCHKGTDLVAEELPEVEAEALRAANSEKVWRDLIQKRFSKIIKDRSWGGEIIKTVGSKAKHPTFGVYFREKQKNISAGYFGLIIWCRIPSEADKIVDRGVRKLLKDLWKDFQNLNFGSETDRQTRLWGTHVPADAASRSRTGKSTMTVMQKFRGGVKKEHDYQSTKAKFAIEKDLDNFELEYKGKYGVVSLDPVKYIKDNMQLDWGQVVKKQQYANFKARNVLTLRLGKNPILDTDVSKLVARVVPHFRAGIDKAERGSLLSIFAESSKPVADQIRDDVIKDITKDYRLAANRPRTKSGAFDMRFKVNQGLKNLKSFKSINRKEKLGGTGSGKGGIKRKQKRLSIAGKLPKGTGKEKGKGTQASTSIAADLARLKREINRNLSAEVTRNMGKPALSYRTGRFANSVQLLNLTQARNTVMAKYTYLLRPYETFENKGKKRWPMAYNPKPLIAKSIRNLAQGRIEQKLTVRRV